MARWRFSLRAALLRTDGPPLCDLENRASGYPATLEAAEPLWHGHDTGHAETNGLLALRFGSRRGLHRERQLREAHVKMRLVRSEPVVVDDSVHH